MHFRWPPDCHEPPQTLTRARKGPKVPRRHAVAQARSLRIEGTCFSDSLLDGLRYFYRFCFSWVAALTTYPTNTSIPSRST